MTEHSLTPKIKDSNEYRYCATDLGRTALFFFFFFYCAALNLLYYRSNIKEFTTSFLLLPILNLCSISAHIFHVNATIGLNLAKVEQEKNNFLINNSVKPVTVSQYKKKKKTFFLLQE